MGEGLMSQTGKLKVWDIWEKQSTVIRINICDAMPQLLPAGGSGEPTGASLTQAWLPSSRNTIVVAAWVVFATTGVFVFRDVVPPSNNSISSSIHLYTTSFFSFVHARANFS